MIDTQLLQKAIQKSGLKKKKIAQMLQISVMSLHRKVTNQTEFKAKEIEILCNILAICDLHQKEQIFFAN